MCITIPNGIIWMVGGGIVGSIFSLFINTYYTGKLINVGFCKQMGDLLPIFGVSFTMWGIVHATFLLTENIYAQLSLGVIVGPLFYIVSAKVLLKSEWSDAVSMILKK